MKSFSELNRVAIISYSKGDGGISEYVNLLVERLRSEHGIDVSVHNSTSTISPDYSRVLIEYAWNLATGEKLLSDVKALSKTQDPAKSERRRIIIEIHDKVKGSEAAEIEQYATLLYRSEEIAARNGSREHLIVPHISYSNLPMLEPFVGSEIKFGWFGLPGKKKRMLEIAKFATTLKVRSKFVVSTSTEESPQNQSVVQSYLKELQDYAKYHSNIEVLDVGFIPLPEILKQMQDCSHIVFAHRNNEGYSGSMMLAKRMNRPIISTDTTQARLAGIYTTSIVSRSFAFADAMRVAGYHLLKEHRFYSYDLKELLRAVSKKQATLEEVLQVRSNTLYSGKKIVGGINEFDKDSLPDIVSILKEDRVTTLDKMA